MHGHAGLVERKIRFWIMRQELDRRREERLARRPYATGVTAAAPPSAGKNTR
jgi:hypothetical protein